MPSVVMFTMPFSVTGASSGLKPNSALVSTFLVANAFVWYLGSFSFLQQNFQASSLLLVISVGIFCLIATAFIVTLLLNRIRQRLSFLKYWIVGGLVLTVPLAFLDTINLSVCVVASAVLGVYFGLGMPTCMGYFAATTTAEKRAKYGAIVILLIGIGFPLISLIGSSTFMMIAALFVWRALALAGVVGFKPPERVAEPKNAISYRAVFGNRTFLLYFIPWLMFALINDLTLQLNTQSFSQFPPVFADNYLLIENVLSGISAIACGFLADKRGRKIIALAGFALLGVGYAVLGISNGSYFAAWFYVFADGIAWGAFAMLFIVTLWGDMAHERNSEKYYFLGVLPYLVSNFTGLVAAPFVSGEILQMTVFSFASVFLFIAILPLAYAPETLSEKVIKNIDIVNYADRALAKARKEKAKQEDK